MKQLHTHGVPQTILGFISIHVLFHAVSACASKLHERIKIMAYVPTSFFRGIFLGTARFLAIFVRKKKSIWVSPAAVGGHRVRL